MTGKRNISRRQFFKKAAGAAAGAVSFPYFVPSSAVGKAGYVAPSNRIVMGFIGVGTMGRYDMEMFMNQPDTQVAAVCDVQRKVREAARSRADEYYGKKVCADYNNFWEVTERDDIDAISIASLDSWHVLHALSAVRAGKDVKVQKPLGMSIEDIKVLRSAVHRHGRVFQFGTQQRSSREFRYACELVRNGRIGKLHTIEVGVHAGGPEERYGKKTYTPMPVPEGIDYDLWVGPSPMSPYTDARLIYPHWFHISDYSLGYVSGWGIHHIDIAQWGSGNENTGPIDVEGTAVYPGDDALCDNPVSWDVNFKYADGVRMRFTGAGPGFAGVWSGIKFIGTKGWVFVNRGQIRAEPEKLLQETIGPDEIHLIVSDHHERNFLDCVESRAETICPIDVAVRSDTVCQLAWIAFTLGRKLKWDPEKEEFAGDAEANSMLTRAKRSPWHL